MKKVLTSAALSCSLLFSMVSPMIVQANGEAEQTLTFEIDGVEFSLKYVEGGTFTMGSDEQAAQPGTQTENQKNEHQVTLDSYYMAETETTRALWKAVMGGSWSEKDQIYPVASVTVPDCQEFVQRLNQIAKQQNLLEDGQSFVLPTEAQWEYAAKGGQKSQNYLYAGSNTLSEVGWTSRDGFLHPVKQKKANELGLYDMSGNVYEWVADYAAPYSTESQTNPCNTTPSSQYIKRGGSFYYSDSYRFTTTYRYFYEATDYTIGFRIALKLEDELGSGSESSNSSQGMVQTTPVDETVKPIVAPDSVRTGWYKESGIWYFYDQDGSMVKDTWIYDNGEWYKLDERGQMYKSQFLLDEAGRKVYVDCSGRCLTNTWFKPKDGYWYYALGNGQIAENTAINGWPVDSYGRWTGIRLQQ